jgi:hypothetical protein
MTTSSFAPRRDLEGQGHAPRSLRRLAVTDSANPYRMAATEARVVDVCPDEDWRYKDPMSIKYTSGPFLSHEPDRGRWRLSA